MGCFSFKCKVCGRPVRSDSFRGERVFLVLLKNGKPLEHMNGEYDSYGRVFDEHGESIEWKMEWGKVCDLMFSDDKSNGIMAIHEECCPGGKSYLPATRSENDPDQGWGPFKIGDETFGDDMDEYEGGYEYE